MSDNHFSFFPGLNFTPTAGFFLQPAPPNRRGVRHVNRHALAGTGFGVDSVTRFLQ